MFEKWLSKVYEFLKNPLTQSEINQAWDLFISGYSPRGAAEYFRS